MTTLIKGAFVYAGAGFSKLDVLITDGKINTLVPPFLQMELTLFFMHRISI